MASLKKTTQQFLRKSQKKIQQLKTRLQQLSKSEEKLEKEEVDLLKKSKKLQEVKVSLSIDSVFKAAFAILGVVALVYLLIYIKNIIILFLVALFLAAAFNPAVDKLEKYHIPRALGILIMYILVLGIFVLMFTSLVPIVAEQISGLAGSIKDMVQNLVSAPEGQQSWLVQKIQPFLQQFWQNVDQKQLIASLTNTLKEVGSQLTNFAGNALGAIFVIFNGLFNTFLVLIVAFFMILNKQHTSDFFHSLFPHKYSDYISAKTKETSIRIGEWIRGQVFLAIAMGLLTLIIFSLIGIHYATTLALVSAISEFIPYLGPLITFVSAALIAVNQDPILLLWLIPAYAVIQFVEGNILVPLIIGRSVGLNPIVVLFALLVGATLGVQLGGSYALGLVGMIIAVPVANIISIFVEEYTERNK